MKTNKIKITRKITNKFELKLYLKSPISKDMLNEFDTKKIVIDNNKINCSEIIKNLNI